MEPGDYLFEQPKSKSRRKARAKDQRTNSPTPIKQEVDEDLGHLRSPTPPAVHTRTRHGDGNKYLYSDHDRQYFTRYVTVLLERDPEMGVTAIARALAHKVRLHLSQTVLFFYEGTDASPFRSIMVYIY